MKSYCVKQKNRLSVSSQVARRLQKMGENNFGAHAPKCGIKKTKFIKGN